MGDAKHLLTPDSAVDTLCQPVLRNAGVGTLGETNVQTSSLALLGGGAVAVAVGAAIYLRPLPEPERAAVEPSEVVAVEEAVAGFGTTDEPEKLADLGDGGVDETGEAAAQSVAVTEAEASVEETVEPADDTQDETADIAAQPDDVPDVIPADPPPAVSPVLTEFRFEADGAVLVSGMADIGTEVAILIDGTEVDRLEVGFDGAFFYTGFLGFSDNPRVLSVVADPDGAELLADRTFVMAANPEPVVVAQVEHTPEVAATEEAPTSDEEVVQPLQEQQIEELTSEEPTSEEPQSEDPLIEETVPSEEPVVAETVVEDPVAPAILSVTEDGVDVVRAPIADTSPEVMSTVALDAITYDTDGEVVLQGRALGEGFVQVYVDNAPISRLPVEADGSWRGDLPDVDKGVYTLRIDEVDEDGDVVSRIETPFLREDPETVAEALEEEVTDPEFSVATRTVQPGSTLWAIAEERYGSGVLFVTVFEANRDRIRDPDLIYPGQVFVLPNGTE